MKVRTWRGDRLREARKARGLSQSQLAQRVGSHVTSVSDWERGANAPSGRHVTSLAQELGVDAGHFYGDDEDEESDPVTVLMTALRRVVREEMSRS